MLEEPRGIIAIRATKTRLKQHRLAKSPNVVSEIAYIDWSIHKFCYLRLICWIGIRTPSDHVSQIED